MKKMHLEDAFDDNPRTRNLLKLMEEDAEFVRDYSFSLQCHLGKVLNAQNDLCNALSSFSCFLRSYNEKRNSSRSDSILPDVMGQFASKIDDLSSMHQISISQIADALPSLKKFALGDVTELFVLREVFNTTRNDLNQVLGNHLKFPKRRENERQARELEDEMFIIRKKFHETALKYYSSLNTIQPRSVVSLMEPLISLIKAHVTHSDLSSEFVKSLKEENFCGHMEAAIQSTLEGIIIDKMHSIEEVERLQKNSVDEYFVEPPPEHKKPSLNNKQRAGFLMLRSKTGLLTSKWDQYYFFIQGGSLMYQGVDEMAGQSLVDLGFETYVDSTDIDDRRYVFTVNQPTFKKQVILQADSYHNRDNWMTTIINASRECSYQSHASSPIAQASQVLSDDGTLLFTAPIQFDIITPFQGNNFPNALPENPNDDKGVMRAADGGKMNSLGEFLVGFMGSQQIESDRGDHLLKETMRQILAARALHNIFKMPQYKLVLSQDSLILLNAQVNTIKSEFSLANISFWGVHEDNERLFGFIIKSNSVVSKPNFMCYVFECNSGYQICEALMSATEKAYEAYLAKEGTSPQREMESPISKGSFLQNIKDSTST